MSKRGENIYKRKDGRYEGRYVIGKTANGRTRFGYVYGRQYAEVRKKLLRMKAKLLSETDDPSCRMTLACWMKRWMETELLGSVKPSSYQTYCTQARRHVLPALGAFPLCELTPEEVRDFVRGMEHQGLSSNTVRGAYRLLHSSLHAARDRGLIRRDPCAGIRFKAEERREQRVLSAREQACLHDTASGGDGLFALMGLYTGMRLGEICALKWSDIDWERKTVAVRRTAQRVVQPEGSQSRTALMTGAPKSAHSRRVIPLADFLLEMLRDLRKNSRGEFIFGGGKAAEPRTMQRRFGRLIARAGLKDAHFHTLRHSFATRMLELGVDVKTVSALLGHASAKQTLDCYAHSLPEQQRIAVERLAARNV